MRAGKLRKHLFIQRATTAQDSYGEPVETWHDWKRAWAEVMPVNGSEQVVSNASEARITHRVTIRYAEGLTAKMRFRYGTRILAMVPPLNDGEIGKEMVIACTEVLP